jgi:hypothetical protein
VRRVARRFLRSPVGHLAAVALGWREELAR